MWDLSGGPGWPARMHDFAPGQSPRRPRLWAGEHTPAPSHGRSSGRFPPRWAGLRRLRVAPAWVPHGPEGVRPTAAPSLPLPPETAALRRGRSPARPAVRSAGVPTGLTPAFYTARGLFLAPVWSRHITEGFSRRLWAQPGWRWWPGRPGCTGQVLGQCPWGRAPGAAPPLKRAFAESCPEHSAGPGTRGSFPPVRLSPGRWGASSAFPGSLWPQTPSLQTAATQ